MPLSPHWQLPRAAPRFTTSQSGALRRRRPPRPSVSRLASVGVATPGWTHEKSPALRGFPQCARGDSNFHGPFSPQRPQPRSLRVDGFSGAQGRKLGGSLDNLDTLDGMDGATVLPRVLVFGAPNRESHYPTLYEHGAVRTRALVLANCASLAISAERPAISECRYATLAGAGFVSVPARDRNQGSHLGGRVRRTPERAAALAGGETHVRDPSRSEDVLVL